MNLGINKKNLKNIYKLLQGVYKKKKSNQFVSQNGFLIDNLIKTYTVNY